MVSGLKCQNSLLGNVTNKRVCIMRRIELLTGEKPSHFQLTYLLLLFLIKGMPALALFLPEQDVHEKIKLL